MAKLQSRTLSRRHMMTLFGTGIGLSLIGQRPARAAAGPSGPVRALAFDGPALILAADAFWRSSDGGAGWTEMPGWDATSVTALATHNSVPGRIFAALRTGGVIRSDDAGTTWVASGAGLPDAPVAAITSAAQAPDTLYAAIDGDGLWQSEDAGESWAFVMDRPYQDAAEHDVLAMVSVNLASGMGGIWVYAGTERGLIRVPDCFCRWQDVQAGDAMDALASGIDPAPQYPLPADEAVVVLAAAPGMGELLYAGLTSGIWTSTDAGVNWTKVHPFAARHLAIDPDDPAHLVAADDTTILASRNGGTSWSTILNI